MSRRSMGYLTAAVSDRKTDPWFGVPRRSSVSSDSAPRDEEQPGVDR